MSSSEVDETDEAADTVEVDEARESLVTAFRDEFGDSVVGSHVDPGVDVWIRVTTEVWRAAGEFARDQLACSYFDFLSAIDWLPSPFGRDMDAQEDVVADAADGVEEADGGAAEMEQGVAGGDTRFQLLARVHSPAEGHGLFLKCDLEDDPPRADSWVPVYAGANWHERETAEMFGIDFVGHPHLVKLYLPGEFEGYPLRKDFPLLARRVKPWPGIVDVEHMPGEDDDDATTNDDTADGGDA